jgi:hypothetical protein
MTCATVTTADLNNLMGMMQGFSSYSLDASRSIN